VCGCSLPRARRARLVTAVGTDRPAHGERPPRCAALNASLYGLHAVSGRSNGPRGPRAARQEAHAHINAMRSCTVYLVLRRACARSLRSRLMSRVIGLWLLDAGLASGVRIGVSKKELFFTSMRYGHGHSALPRQPRLCVGRACVVAALTRRRGRPVTKTPTG
jgi:hypothetical protein